MSPLTTEVMKMPPSPSSPPSRLGGGSLFESVEISVIQVNLNKAHGAQVELLNKINKLASYITLVTEPYCYKKNF